TGGNTAGLRVLTTQDRGQVIKLDIDSTVGTGATLRGIRIDADGATCGAGETFYAFDADMDAMTTGGTVYGHYLQMPVGSTGVVLEAITGNDVANDIIGTAITKTLTITGAVDVAMTNPIADMNATLTNAGGGKASWDNYFIDMDYAASQADDTNTWSGGFISMVATESVGTLNLQGNMVDMVLPGTQSADLVGIHLDFNQDANAHNFYGIEVDGVGMTPGAGNEYGIYVHGAFDYDIYTDGPVFFDSIDITPSTNIDALDILGTNMTSA
ncbi:unnamed protein product, partial [marine sediment metagenome]